MKKYLALLLALMMVLALCACGETSEKPETAGETAQGGETAQMETPAAEQPAPAAERVLLCSEEFSDYAEEDETYYRYDLYASAIPAALAASGDKDSSEYWFEFSEEYESESRDVEYETEISGTLRDALSEEEVREQLQSTADNLSAVQNAFQTVSEIETVKGNGYTAYYVRGVRPGERELMYFAYVCFDGEYFSADIEFEARAYLDSDISENSPDYGTDFDPQQYVKNAENEFLAFLGSLSFEKTEVEE